MDIYYIVLLALLILTSALLFQILLRLKLISEILAAIRKAQYSSDKTFVLLADLQRSYMEVRVAQEKRKGC